MQELVLLAAKPQRWVQATCKSQSKSSLGTQVSRQILRQDRQVTNKVTSEDLHVQVKSLVLKFEFQFLNNS